MAHKTKLSCTLLIVHLPPNVNASMDQDYFSLVYYSEFFQYSGSGITHKDGFDRLSLAVQLDEENDFVHAETEAYAMSSLLGDIGGAAGLFLGLSVVVMGSVSYCFHMHVTSNAGHMYSYVSFLA